MSPLRNTAMRERLAQRVSKLKPENTIRKYYGNLLQRALVEALAAIGITKPTEIFRTLVVWSATVLLLYSIGWSKIPFVGTENPDASSEVRLGLSALAAIVFIFVATFVWKAFALPPRIDQELRAEVATNTASLLTEADIERELLTLSQMRREGLELYENIKDPTNDEEYHAWRSGLDAWVQRVKDRLDERWSVAARHEFDDAGRSGGWTRVMKNRDAQSEIERRSEWLLSRYTSYFNSLDDLVRRGHHLFVGTAVVDLAGVENQEEN